MVIAEHPTIDSINVIGDDLEEDNSSLDNLWKSFDKPGFLDVLMKRFLVATIARNLENVKFLTDTMSFAQESFIENFREFENTSQSTLSRIGPFFREFIEDDLLIDEPLDLMPIRTGTINLHITYRGKGEPILHGNSDLDFIDGV